MGSMKKDICDLLVDRRLWIGIMVWLVFLLLGYCVDNSIKIYGGNKAAVTAAIGAGIVMKIWRYQKNVIAFMIVSTILIGALPLISYIAGNAVKGMIVVQNLSVGLLWASLVLLAIVSIKKQQYRRWILCRYVVGSIALVPIIMALPFWFYFSLNREFLRPDIILTLYQTNRAEALAYIQSQPITNWALAVLSSILIIGLYGYLILKISGKDRRPLFNGGGAYLFLGILGLVLGTSLFHYGNKNWIPIWTKGEVSDALKSYESFAYNKTLREKRLSQIKGISVDSSKKGIYVLIVGESESRTHMSVYGYNRETTPWISSMAKKDGTIVFTQPYSNHTHTVPSLTYALSEKNQYNDVSLKDAYSLIEVAKAAGMKTYWISNQEKYGSWDTPVAEMASTAEYQIWINENVGRGTTTAHYDEELVRRIDELQIADNSLVVFHVMGSHGNYGDRYPKEYALFTGEDSIVDEYDNSVRYNDFVLERIYEKMVQYPNFMSMVVFSDHGEDPDNHKGHESSKFTPSMSEIPFIAIFSPRYRMYNEKEYNQLLAHKDNYWTNDLLYNAMVSIMGIEGIPLNEPWLDISSDSYDRNRENLRTLHGERALP